MNHSLLRILFCLPILCVGLVGSARSENWPGWRGPRGDGTSTDSKVPTEWDGPSGKNIAWKTEIRGVGHSSPVVWGEKVFVTSCVEEANQRVLSCLSRDSGKVLWEKVVVESAPETVHNLNSRASGTPATDGKHVYVSFLKVEGKIVPAPNVGTPRPITAGEIVVACYDMDGKETWSRTVGSFISAHGFCTSPVIYRHLLIVNGDHDGDSYVAGLNNLTGEAVWKTPRVHKTRSYVTPLIREVDGQDQLVMSGSKRVISLDPLTGERQWTIEGPTEQFVASMVYDGERFYMCAGFPTYHVMGIRGDGRGDVTETHVDWHVNTARCYVPSPVVLGPYLLVADDRGTANCFNAATGERHWQGRLGRHFSASLVTASGLVYFFADDGEAYLVRPGKEMDLVQTNNLGERVFASPAISDNQLFVRGEKNLYCIQTK
jgi:outer membrane protein assembly factor BamB